MEGSWIYQRYTWFCVLKILSILNVLSSEYAKGLMCQESEYAILKGSE